MGVKPMTTHFRVISSDDYNKALDVIQKQRTLFVNTVEQFKKDITFLEGCLTIMSIEHDKTRYLTHDSLMFIKAHLSEMQSMLNDFDTVLSRKDDRESALLYNNNEEIR
jgi:hypothetical protein